MTAPSGRPDKRSEKSANAFRTISEVADELDLKQHVLRFWETRFPQIKPMKGNGGRRYYRPQDVALLKRLQVLLHDEKYTIKGVQQLLREEGAGKFIEEGQAVREEDRSQLALDLGASSSHSDPETTGLDGAQRQTLNELLQEMQDMKELLRSAG